MFQMWMTSPKIKKKIGLKNFFSVIVSKNLFLGSALLPIFMFSGVKKDWISLWWWKLNRLQDFFCLSKIFALGSEHRESIKKRLLHSQNKIKRYFFPTKLYTHTDSSGKDFPFIERPNNCNSNFHTNFL